MTPKPCRVTAEECMLAYIAVNKLGGLKLQVAVKRKAQQILVCGVGIEKPLLLPQAQSIVVTPFEVALFYR